MVILSRLEFGLVVLGAFIVGAVAMFLLRQIQVGIERRNLEKEAQFQLEIDRMRDEIRQAIMDELGENEEEDKSADDVHDS